MYNIDIQKLKTNQKGVTLIALVIMIIVLLILSGIGIYSGRNSLNKANLEELKTNMLLIKAKAREYVEETNFKIGKETDATKINEIKSEVYEDSQKLKKASDSDLQKINISGDDVYEVTEETLALWGLEKIKTDSNEKYLIEFNDKDLNVEVYNTKGYEGKYSLTNIEK